ncbi:hypothetical protein [Brevibacillus sp. FSL K6-2834]|uniref:hypothetical protein n=1 Tax=Brevibacillus sp. FSL K6-2834 TaxID=2954680 RepID=UPI0031593477
MEEKDLHKFRFDLLTKAIEDTQHTVRFTDGKAGAVITFWGIVLTSILRTNESWYPWLKAVDGFLDRFFVYSCIFFLLFFFVRSIWIALKVITPKINPLAQIDCTGYEPKGLFYLHQLDNSITGKHLFHDRALPKLTMTTADYMEKLKDTKAEDILCELAIELQKVSFIRNVKVARVNDAINSVKLFLVVFGVIFLYGFCDTFFR